MGMRIGTIHLTVADLERSIGYYETQIGLRLHRREDGFAALGTGGEDLLALTELPGARPADGYAGLFHFALLVPERTDLARWLTHAARERIALTGLSDHLVSEAIYLRDPDGHGVEIYADRPRAQWEGKVGELLVTLPLDTDDLLASLDDPRAGFDGLAPGTTMGHVHLRVSDLTETTPFYRDVIGLDVMGQLGSQASFYASGGYHHHVGANTWESRGAPPAPEGHATLVSAELVFDDDEAFAAVADRAGGDVVKDPSGNPLRLVQRSA
ncbi:MAG: catechol 2,3-dioxygenase [Solirubrobacteraceae bacterium]|nr:catechol 2,3-dioxygenase [Solirubrobacteraceae bacterium]